MAHEVHMTQGRREIGGKDVEFHVRAGGDKLGTLMISRGGIEWRRAYVETKTVSMGWEQFAQMLEESRPD